MDVERAAQLYAEGWTLSQIGAELGVRWNVVHDHLRRAGATMRPVGALLTQPPPKRSSTCGIKV